MPVPVEQDVPRLQVSVQDLLRVNVVQRDAHLSEQPQDLLRHERVRFRIHARKVLSLRIENIREHSETADNPQSRDTNYVIVAVLQAVLQVPIQRRKKVPSPHFHRGETGRACSGRRLPPHD